jgi:hypothetical protein
MRGKQSRRSPKITGFVGILLLTVVPCKTCFLLRLPKKEAVTREEMALEPFQKAKAVFEFLSPARSPGFSALSEQIKTRNSGFASLLRHNLAGNLAPMTPTSGRATCPSTRVAPTPVRYAASVRPSASFSRSAFSCNPGNGPSREA